MSRFGSIQLLIALCVCGTSGCAVINTKPHRNYDTIAAGPQRDARLAKELNEKAIDFHRSGNLIEARRAVDEALIADVDHAPAHNTLGRIYYCQKNYYLAAWEFEFAIRLYPDVPEYHNNLGLVYEASDKLPKAIEEFQLATNLDSGNHNYLSNLTRARVRNGERSPGTRHLLEQVVLMDPRPEWKGWAREQLTTTHLDYPSGLPDDPTPIGVFFDSVNVLPPDSVIELAPSNSPVIPDSSWESLPKVPDSNINSPIEMPSVK